MAFHQQEQGVEDLRWQCYGPAVMEQLLIGGIQEKATEFVCDLGSAGHICHRGRDDREYIRNASRNLL